MTNDIALVETIEHWERMIAWVKTQNPKEEPDKEVMEQVIDEHWRGNYCPLCEMQQDSCEGCVLFDAQNEKSCGCEGTLWRGVAYSTTWKEWLLYAEQLLELLKSLEKKGEKQ